MQRYRLWIVLVILLTVPVSAQYKDRGLSIGAGFGGAIGINESNHRPAKSQARGYLTCPLHDRLLAELSAGYAYNSGQDYLTSLIPIDFRVRFSPFSSERWVPYVYAGFGALFIDGQVVPPSLWNGIEPEVWAPHLPLGIGLEYRITGNLSLDVNGGGVQSLSDELNQPRDGKKDGYWSVMAGLTFTMKTGAVDSDGDGLSDDTEEEIGTDHESADTDRDGLSDGEEFNIYKTSPWWADTDGDGLKDGDEVRIYKTDPLKADTDRDGLNDGDEVMKCKTDPLKADTDGDGLKDGEELTRYRTDPLKADTDGGSVGDGEEVARGTKPLNPNDDVAKKEKMKLQVGKKIVLEGVVFHFGSAKITPASAQILDKVFRTLNENPKLRAEVHGHTDNISSHAFNMTLSRARADAVKAYLVRMGISSGRLIAKGFGPDRPVASNATPEGRHKNRRVEFLPRD